MKVKATKNVNPFWKRDGFESEFLYIVDRKKPALLQAWAMGDEYHPYWDEAVRAKELGLIEFP